MKKKGVGKKILSALLVFSMLVCDLPAGQIFTFADTETTVSTTDTKANVELVESYASSNVGSYGSTWNSSAVLDAYMRLDAGAYYGNVSNYYNSDIANSYTQDSLTSVPMGLALLDIMNGAVTNVALSSNTVVTRNGSSSFNALTGNLEINDPKTVAPTHITAIDIATIATGDSATITINGYWHGTTGFKVVLGDVNGANTDANSSEFVYTDLPEGAFSESFTVTAKSDIEYLYIMGADLDAMKYIDGLEIESITISQGSTLAKATTNTTTSETNTASPFSIANGLIDESDYANNFDLSSIYGATTKEVYDPSEIMPSDFVNSNLTEETEMPVDTFVNGVVITEFKGKLYLQWQSSDIVEDSSDTWVAYSVSADGGATWSEPAPIATPANFNNKGFCSSGGWHVNDNGTVDINDDVLVAYLNYWVLNSAGQKSAVYTYYRTFDGSTWSGIGQVRMKNGSVMAGIFEQDPHVITCDDGSKRIVNSAHFGTNLIINPIYTDDMSGLTGWIQAEYYPLSTTDKQEIEPSIFENANGDLVMIFRNQNGDNVLASVSEDDGVTWSRAVSISTLYDVKQKQSAGNLADGTAYIVNVPALNSKDADKRRPLAITLSGDGITFTKSYLLGSYTMDDVVYKIGKYENNTWVEDRSISKKRQGYHYPKSALIGDNLYVAYAKNKEIAEYIKIPVSAISLNKPTVSQEGKRSQIQYIFSELEDQKYYLDSYMYYSTADADDTLELEDVYMTTQFLLECVRAIEDGTLVLTTDDGLVLDNNADAEALEYYFYAPVVTRLNWISNNMFDSATGLFANEYTVSESSKSSNYWSRGIASYAMALVSALEVLPAKYSTERAGLIDTLKTLFDGMLEYQDEATGMWTNTVNVVASDSNKLETSGSSMMAYALMRAYYSGWVTDDSYGEAGLKAFNGVVDSCETDGTLSSMTNIYENGSYVADSATGIAPLILASTLAVGVADELEDDSSSNGDWVAVDVPGGNTYRIERTMSPDNTQGYVITRHGLADPKPALGLNVVSDTEYGQQTALITLKNSTNTLIGKQYDANGDPIYNNDVIADLKFYTGELTGVTDKQLWLIDDEGYIYSKYNSDYYLSIDNGSLTIVKGNNLATKWISEEMPVQDSRSYLYGAGTNYYLNYPKDKDTGENFNCVPKENENTSINGIMLWTLQNNTTKYAKLAGEISYSASAGPNAVTVSQILNGIRVQVKDSESATEYTEVTGTDSNVTYKWDNGFDSTVPGTYSMSIYYYGVKVGSVSVEITESIYKDAYLTGELSHEINKGDTLTEDDIKSKASVKVTIDGVEETIPLTDTSKVTCVWNKEYKTNVAGTYVMTVYCGGVQVGQITVEVSANAVNWVDVKAPTGYYKVVHSMDQNSERGYLITRKGIDSNITKQSISADNDLVELVDFGKLIQGQYTSTSKNDYWVAEVDAEDIGDSHKNIWRINANNNIYTEVSGINYYLNIDENNKLTTGTTATNSWGVADVGEYSELSLITTHNNSTYYLYCTGGKLTKDGTFDVTTDTGKAKGILIWEEEYTTGQAALVGKTLYNIAVGDSSVNVGTIQKKAAISLKKSVAEVNDGKVNFSLVDPITVPWSDELVTFSWDRALNTSVEGAYVMTVRYNGVVLGTITVNVGDITWTDVTDYVYERTTTITPGKYYIITESGSNSTIDGGTETTIKAMGAGFDPNKVKSSWSTKDDVKVAKVNGGYSITYTDDNVIGAANRWYCDAKNYLYVTLDRRPYYLRAVNASNNSGNEISVNNSYDWAAPWTATAYNSTGQTTLHAKASIDTTVNGTTTTTISDRYLTYTYIGFQSVENADATVTLYTPVANTTLQEVGMIGEDNYTVIKDNNNMSETYLQARTSFYLKTTTADGASSVRRLAWSELERTWEPTLNANVAGTYIMTVSYNDQVVGQITVNVKSLDDAVIVYDGPDTITTGLGQEPDLSEVSIKITYADGSEEILTIEDGITISNFDITEDGIYYPDITYLGYKLTGSATVSEHETFKLVVDEDPYLNLPETNIYPEYPADGSVRLKKSATNDDTSLIWHKTGVTKVELDVAGTSVKSGVDVILVTDISNSMGREYPANHDRAGQVGQKLNEAMESASELAARLLQNNDDNPDTNNSISFVTFGGYDKDNSETNNSTYKYEDPITHETGTVGMLDATQTVFVYEQSLRAAQKAFNGTKFLTRKSDQTNDTNRFDIVQIMDNEGNRVVGNNSGGTNYDYAFAEATNAVMQLKSAYAEANNGEPYDESGRQIVLLFMTDGAPTYYNYEGVGIGQSGSANYLYGTYINYPTSPEKYLAGIPDKLLKIKELEDGKFYEYVSSADANSIGYKTLSTATSEVYYDAEEDLPEIYYDHYGTIKTFADFWSDRSDAWYASASKPNQYAVELNGLVDAFYAVGFKMSEDLGVSKHCYNWDEKEEGMFSNVLAGVAGVENGKQAVDGVYVAEHVEELTDAYIEMTEQVTNSGTYAKVNDVIDSEFTLLKDSVIKTTDGTNVTVTDNKGTDDTSDDVTKNAVPTIEYNRYVLSNGVRTGDYVTIESVSLSYDANGVLHAYSNLNPTVDILVDTSATDNYYQIVANNFIYTYDDGVEYFDWDIMTIAGYEYSLSYYAYLKGTNKYYTTTGNYDAQGNATIEREDNQYDTNESATLTYVDINGDKATRTFEKPYKVWGDAVTQVEFYLVNEDGNLINRNNVEITEWDNRVPVDVSPGYLQNLITYIYLEATENQEVTITAQELEQYLPAGFKLYDQEASYKVSVDSQKKGELIITETTKSSDEKKQTTLRVDDNAETNPTNVAQTKVAFAVYYVNDSTSDISPASATRVVIDYGKAIQVDVLETNHDLNQMYNVEVVGFVDYSSDPSVISTKQEYEGVTKYVDPNGYGTFTIAGGSGDHLGHYVQFKPAKMVDKVVKVFVALRVKYGTTIDYLAYQELDVIPATNVYYETNFADDVFSFKQNAEEEDWPVRTDALDSSEESDQIQDKGTVGFDQTYGYDSSYAEDSGYSDGSSHFVEGQGSAKTVATFEFTGTGFDIISRTGAQQGMINVKVYEVDANGVRGDRVKNVSVLNKSSDSEDIEAGGEDPVDSRWELCQVPVMSIEDLPHGTYVVDIGVLKASSGHTGSLAAVLNRGGEFYFDAVRIYDPINVETADRYTYAGASGYTLNPNADTPTYTYSASDSIIAKCAYADDGEANENISEIRNLLITADKFDALGTGDYSTGAVFLDRNYGDDGQVTTAIADYKAAGPNNELYLGPGQAVILKLTISDYEKLTGIDIGAKCVKTEGMVDAIYKGTALNVKLVPCNTTDLYNLTVGGKIEHSWLLSGSLQYYPIETVGSVDTNSDGVADRTATLSDVFELGDGSAYLYIQNYQDKAECITSITDIKICYSDAPQGEASYIVSYEVADVAAQLYVEPDYAIEDVTLTASRYKLFSNAYMIAETDQNVTEIKVTNEAGSSVLADTMYIDSKDGSRTWLITTTVLALGDCTYNLTGYSKYGKAGETKQVNFKTSLTEGGGKQDEKNIFKTLFNCRILSIERGNSDEL